MKEVELPDTGAGGKQQGDGKVGVGGGGRGGGGGGGEQGDDDESGRGR